MLTETPLEVQLGVDRVCRAASPAVPLVCADVFGAFATLFTDFGNAFEVVDSTGEDLREVFISDVSKVRTDRAAEAALSGFAIFRSPFLTRNTFCLSSST